jgi:hypothetical protein
VDDTCGQSRRHGRCQHHVNGAVADGHLTGDLLAFGRPCSWRS